MPTVDETKSGLFAMTEAGRGRVFDLAARRKLGITEGAVRASLEARAAAGEFDTWTEENQAECLAAKGQLLALSVADDIRAQNAPAWCAAYEAGAIDFEALLAFISKLMEMLMPFVIKRRQAALRAAPPSPQTLAV